jgi:hypothetical protein
MHERKHSGNLGRRASAIVFLPICLAAYLASGCRHQVQARTTPEPPPLDVPLPPPRLVEAAETAPPEPVALLPEPARGGPLPRTPPATPQLSEAAKSEPPEPPKAPDELKPPAAATLRTTPTEEEGTLDRRTRGLLVEATTHLSRIDYVRLNADAKSQYDSARAFVRQAEEALRGRNLVFASYLADKAATLAVQLRGQ